MNLDGDEIDEIKSSGDSQLVRMVPSRSDAVSSGIFASFSLSGGKSIKALFNYLTEYDKFTFDFYQQGFQIDGVKLNTNGTIDTLSYMIYKADRLIEYIFCPQNVPGYENNKSISVRVSSKNFYSFLKKTRASTSIRVELNKTVGKLILYVINGGTCKPFYLDYEWCHSTPCPISGEIINPSLPPNHKTLIEVFCAEMSSQSTKYGEILYDFNIAIYSEGIFVWSDAPGPGGTAYGKTQGEYIQFQLSVECAKRWQTLFRISINATLSLYAINNEVLKLCMPISSAGEMYIFQYPKLTNPMMSSLTTQRGNMMNSNIIYPQQQIIPLDNNFSYIPK